MIDRMDIVTTADTWIGTRWQHQGRSAAGIDCIGLVECVGQALGLVTTSALTVAPGYSRIPDGRELMAGLDAHMRRLAEIDAAQPGDVLLMRFEVAPQHVALVAPGAGGRPDIIHAWAGARRVVRHGLDALWRSRCVAAYTWPALVKGGA